MTPEKLADYCLAKPGAWADEPWEDDKVAKVHDKIFAFMGRDTVGLKAGANREEADEWLLRYPDDDICDAVDTSYALVVAKLPKKHRPDGWDS